LQGVVISVFTDMPITKKKRIACGYVQTVSGYIPVVCFISFCYPTTTNSKTITIFVKLKFTITWISKIAKKMNQCKIHNA